ncbi:MAG: adenosine deaminase [Spirochaetes bacterium]|nr:adenosine deaminase [Spirochaetota bacterium]
MKPAFDIIKELPKVDLHRHLDGSLRVRSILEIANQQQYTLPSADVKELEKYVTVAPDCRSLGDFLKAFETFYPILMNPSAMERIAFEASEDAFQDNVKYCEFRFAPVLQAKGDFSMQEILQGVLKGLEKAHTEYDIINPLILCCYRSESPASSLETVKLALENRKSVVGIDLAGDEEHYSAKDHLEAFQLAKENDLPITIHAGEAGTVHNIREAVELLHASRIGHGIHIIDDKDLYDYFKKNQIPLEMCLTSNIQTTVVPDLATHPFRSCYHDGLKVTINTDDPGVSSITLSDELHLLTRQYDLTIDDIKKIISNGIDASFTTEERKAILKKKFFN